MKRIISLTLIIWLVVISITSSIAQNIYVPLGTTAGEPYGYVYYKPDGATKLLISLHGFGERGNGKDELYKVENVGAAKLVKDKLWTRSEFVVVSPQYSLTSTGAYHKTLHSFILQQCKKHSIDTTEVYLIGLSGGANSIYGYIVQPYSVKAAVVISGAGSYTKAYLARCKLWALHGEKDDVINYSGAKLFVDNYNKVPRTSPGKFTLFPFAGHIPYVWETSYRQNDIYDWMLK
jgi:predicted peptidase